MPSEKLKKTSRVLIRPTSDVEEQIKEMSELQKLFQNKLTSLHKYADYLERVRSTYSDQFPDIADILNRYTTLKKSNTDLIQERKQMEETHE